ncbi:hypothetical protein Patl1_05421 [Pistacia atlantica]|uniref:Uncharacterized protein n=1 Tax=Pistacia atlantica TaxID=434234 RepID=A0ACC1BSP6_9ROSI|nr:hypothetical protein Patl1_05421 [Pistacia atlantica]
MEIITSTFFSPQFFVVAVSILLCLLLALLAVRSTKSPKTTDDTGADASAKKKPCNCSCSCNGVVGNNHLESADSDMLEIERSTPVAPAPAVVVERGSGASMMEQLVPEITTHALSYLDYPSLCRLSMTNSLMRKAANDDNAWKALYHKVM